MLGKLQKSSEDDISCFRKVIGNNEHISFCVFWSGVKVNYITPVFSDIYSLIGFSYLIVGCGASR